MVRFIVAIDEQRGMANEHGIPWQGKLPTDIKFFRDSTKHSIVVMGYKTYTEFRQPLSDRVNYVVTRPGTEELREGFLKLEDPNHFLRDSVEDVWVIGGGGVFKQTLDEADELCITQLEGSYDCTVFFPEYDKKFILDHESEPYTENGITFRFQVWKRKEA